MSFESSKSPHKKLAQPLRNECNFDVSPGVRAADPNLSVDDPGVDADSLPDKIKVAGFT
jgi:hypothetical protein